VDGVAATVILLLNSEPEHAGQECLDVLQGRLAQPLGLGQLVEDSLCFRSVNITQPQVPPLLIHQEGAELVFETPFPKKEPPVTTLQRHHPVERG